MRQINQQNPQQNQTPKKKRSRFARTPLRKSVLFNFLFIFVPGLTIWIVFGHDISTIYRNLPFQNWNIGYHAIIACGLLIYAITLALFLIYIFKATEPDQLLYATTLMAILMSAYLSSFTTWNAIIRILLCLAVLLIFAFLTNGVANILADNKKRKLQLKMLEKINSFKKYELDDFDKKYDLELLDFFGVQYNKENNDALKKVAFDKSQNNLKKDADGDQKKIDVKKESVVDELEALREIKYEDHEE